MRRRYFESGCTLVFAVMTLDSSTWLSFAFFWSGRTLKVCISVCWVWEADGACRIKVEILRGQDSSCCLKWFTNTSPTQTRLILRNRNNVFRWSDSEIWNRNDLSMTPLMMSFWCYSLWLAQCSFLKSPQVQSRDIVMKHPRWLRSSDATHRFRASLPPPSKWTGSLAIV